ncbi:VOC family protein [Bacillus sp. mrc49]|uniref:VOC family protein n=1 Tax=Bacillus sp. mrc49 TaxID=2054913 RepID=UPI000C271662|nr:VOC family protein [Bacillus sp. mrc49]PJN88457.1 glyoxalase [Bacillus sp. mrc49]
MKINHLNLTVTDVPATRNFLETYFGLTCIGSKGSGFAAMFDDDGFLLNLMKGKDAHYPKTFHIGFPQKNKQQVDEVNRRLTADGFEAGLPKHEHAYTFYVPAPGGFLVEVYCPIAKEEATGPSTGGSVERPTS